MDGDGWWGLEGSSRRDSWGDMPVMARETGARACCCCVRRSDESGKVDRLSGVGSDGEGMGTSDAKGIGLS